MMKNNITGKAVKIIKHRVGNPINYHGKVGYIGSHIPGSSYVGVYFPRDSIRWAYNLDDLKILDNVSVLKPKTDAFKNLVKRMEEG